MNAEAFETALPFLLTAGLTMLGSLGCLLVLARMEREFDRIVTDAAVPDENRTDELSPEYLGAICNWAIDGASFVAGLLGPGLGLILLFDDLGSTTVVIYFAVLFVTFGGFFLYLTKVPVKGYPTAPVGFYLRSRLVARRNIGPFTPVAQVIVAVNLVIGVLLWLLG